MINYRLKPDATSIIEAAIYETDEDAMPRHLTTQRHRRNFLRRLRRRGFVRSRNGEAYFQPKHWKNTDESYRGYQPKFQVFRDVFKTRSSEARAWLTST